MPLDKPQPRLLPIPFGKVWDESTTPPKVGGSGLVACQNLLYRRFGSWAKRGGSAPAYYTNSSGAESARAAGVRWYRVHPSILTQLVVGNEDGLFRAGAPDLTTPTAMGVPFFSDLTLSAPLPSFASMRDPNESSVSGTPDTDILIITGYTVPDGSFATENAIFAGTPTPGQTITWTFVGESGTPTVTGVYTVVAGDTTYTVANNVLAQINTSQAVIGNGFGNSFLSPAYVSVGKPTSTTVELTFTCVDSGAIGNTVTMQFATTGSGITVLPTAPVPFTGGGASFTGPLKYDGTSVTPLSGQIQKPFTGVVTWHNHAWFWGAQGDPDTVFATDINNPEGWTFMQQFGGYDIGVGDGDPMVQACIPVGNTLYVFKTRSVYAITGYDFQSGEYQFNITPVLNGYGIPAPNCLAVLRNAIVFWDGSQFQRLAVGSYAVESIGLPIPKTSQLVAAGDFDLMRTAAGRFVQDTPLGPEAIGSCAFWAVDIGNGVADTILMYDDEASTPLLNYAWSKWTGLEIQGWIPYTGGGTETPALYFIPAGQTSWLSVNQLGGDPFQDKVIGATGVITSNPVAFSVQTGWIDCGNPVLTKELHRVWLHVQTLLASAATFELVVLTNQQNSAETTASTTAPGGDGDSYQDVIEYINPSIRGKMFQFTIFESGAATGYELYECSLDHIEEAWWR